MRSEFVKAEVRRFLDQTPKADVPAIVREYGIHESYALELYNDWARDLPPLMTKELRTMETTLGRVVASEPGQFVVLGEDEAVQFYDGEVHAMQRAIVEWADRTFPDRTLAECFTKLTMDELPEVYKNPTSPEEYADLIVLILDMAVLAVREHNHRIRAKGLPAELELRDIDVVAAVREKMKVNAQRKWATNPRTRLRQHIEE